MRVYSESIDRREYPYGLGVPSVVRIQLTTENIAAWDKKLPPSRLILFEYVLRGVSRAGY